MPYLSDYQRARLGTQLALLTKTMEPLHEFRQSSVGVVVYSLVVQASKELIESIRPPDKKNSLIRRFWSEANIVLKLLDQDPTEDPLFKFNVCLGLLYKLSDDPTFVARQFPAYDKLISFVRNLLGAPEAQRSTIGDAIANDQRVETAVEMAYNVLRLRGGLTTISASPIFTSSSATSAP